MSTLGLTSSEETRYTEVKHVFVNGYEGNGYAEESDFDLREHFSIVSEPTGNCQLCCFSFADTIVDESKNPKEAFYEAISNLAPKPIVLLDITQQTRDTIEPYIDAFDIIQEMEYTSTNDSDMHIVLINRASIMHKYKKLLNDKKKKSVKKKSLSVKK